MSSAIGRIEISPDPLALAHHVAEWITQVALAAQGSFRVSLSGGSTPKHFMDFSPQTNSGTISPGRAFPGIGAMSVLSHTITPKAIFG